MFGEATTGSIFLMINGVRIEQVNRMKYMCGMIRCLISHFTLVDLEPQCSN